MPYPSMTAHEMAKHIGYAHLDDLLAPIIHHSLPPEILHNLQEKFHGLIREDLGRKDAKGLRLPVLEVLVELVVPMMWFPLMEVKGGKVRVCSFSFIFEEPASLMRESRIWMEI